MKSILYTLLLVLCFLNLLRIMSGVLISKFTCVSTIYLINLARKSGVIYILL
jgi:hypothetical protein